MKVCSFVRMAGFVLYLVFALPRSYGGHVGSSLPTFRDKTA